MVNETDRLKRMINNILEFSKMEKGNLNIILPDKSFLTPERMMQEMNYWFEKEQFEIITELDETIYAEVDPEK